MKMWQVTSRNFRLSIIENHHLKSINRELFKSSVAIAGIPHVQKLVETGQVVNSGVDSNVSPAEDIAISPYLSVMSNKTSIRMNQQPLSFDEIPGPTSLRKISKFWAMLPVIGTELTVTIIQYFLNGGKFFGGTLSWGGNTTFFKKFFDIYGPIVRFHGAFGSDIVLLKKPADACAIFENERKYTMRSSLDSIEKYRIECRKYIQAGPFLTYGSEWEKVRKSLDIPFQATVFKQYEEIQKVCEDFIQRILMIRNEHEEVPHDFKVEICKWSLECLSVVSLNKNLGFMNPCGPSSTSDACKLFDGVMGATEAIRRCEYRFHLWKFLETPAWKSLVKNCDKIDTVLNKHVEQTICSLRKKKDTGSPLDRVSFLESILLKEGIVKEDVMTILLDLFLINVNATAHTVALLLYHLSRNPRCQKKVYEEVIEYPENIGRNDLKLMRYLQACIKETQRLNPPIPILSRVLSNDTIIHHYRIPKGTHIIFASYLNIISNEYSEDSSWFKPERWFNDEYDGFKNEYQTLPFGYGPEAYLAKDSSETLIGMLLFKVCRRFRIDYNYGDIKTYNALLVSPTEPLKFRFIRRVQ